jgi:hypothetical protein
MLYTRDGKPYDFTDLLMDEEFVRAAGCKDSAGKYISDLKAQHPDLAGEIDFAIKVLYGLINLPAVERSEGKARTWNRIAEEIHGRSRIKLYRYAAAFLMLIGLCTGLYLGLYRNGTPDIKRYAAATTAEFEKPRLILSDGNSYYISEEESEIRYSENGISISINDSITINQNARADDYNEIVIPYGKSSSLTLSDGSRVWVNAGSRLVFPPVFTGRTREVYVEGEAYFEVVSDNNRKFIVKTDRFEVEVRGTKFSVRADTNDTLFSALLLEGKVAVKTDQRGRSYQKGLELTPGLLAVVNEEGSGFNITRLENPENYIAWRNGYLVFSNEPFRDLLERVKRYYNVEIELRDISMDIRVSGKLDLKEDPERVLNGLSVMVKCKLMKEEGKYIFY